MDNNINIFLSGIYFESNWAKKSWPTKLKILAQTSRACTHLDLDFYFHKLKCFISIFDFNIQHSSTKKHSTNHDLIGGHLMCIDLQMRVTPSPRLKTKVDRSR